MAATQAFLKDSVLQNRIRPGVVKVVLDVDRHLEDGSEVKEVADSTFYMKAIFTKQSLNTFYERFDDSFNSPPDWNHALLLLNQFYVEFQSASAPNNPEKRSRFVLVVERFGLCNLHEGFYSKNQPKNIMEDTDVQAKAQEMENNCMHNAGEGVQSQDLEDVPLSLLLDQLGQSSMDDLSAAVSQDQQEGKDGPDLSRDGLQVACTKQEALDKMYCLNFDDFVVSSEQQAALDAIPEWKDSYVPPAPESSEECQSQTSTGVSLDVAFQGPTLQQEASLAHSSDCPPSVPIQLPDDEGIHRREPDQRQAKTSPALSVSKEMSAGKASPASARKQPNADPVTVSEETPTGKAASGSSRKEQDANPVTVSKEMSAEKAASASTRKEQDANPVTGSEETPTGKAASGNERKQPHTNSVPASSAVSTDSTGISVQGHAVACDDAAGEGRSSVRRATSSHASSASQPGNAGQAVATDSSSLSDASKSSVDSSVGQPSVSFTLSSISNLGDDSLSLGEDPPSLSTTTAGQPADPLCSNEAQDSSAVHHSHKVQGQEQSEVNAKVPSVDADQNGQAVISLGISCEPESVEDTSEAESVKRAVSGLVKMTQTTERDRVNVDLHSKRRRSARNSAVSPSPVVENEESSENEVSHSSDFSVTTTEENCKNEVSPSCGGRAPGSQGFVPTGLATQDWVSCDSLLSDNRERTAACDTGQASESVVPSNVLTQDTMPDDDAAFEKKKMPEKVSIGDRQAVADTSCPLTAHDKGHHRENSCSTGGHTAEDGGNNTCPASERSQTAASTSQAHTMDSISREHPPDTRKLHLAKDSQEHRIVHSTQNVSADSDGSQSPSVLDMSPIPDSSDVYPRTIVTPSRASGTEHPRPTKRQHDRSDTMSQNRTKDQTTSPVYPATKICRFSGILLQKSPGNMNSSRILVDCSVSSDSEDDVDRELIQRATQHGSSKNSAPGSSGEIVVVPDSSQEDVIVILSQSSLEEACNKPSETEAHSVREFWDYIKRPHTNRIREDRVTSIDDAPTHSSGISRKTNCPQSSSKNHENRQNWLRVTKNYDIFSNTQTHTGQTKAKTTDSQYRKTSKKNVHERERYSNKKSKDTQRNRQLQKHVSATDRSESTFSQSFDIEDPSSGERSDSDVSEDEHSLQRVSPGHKRVCPSSSGHLHSQKRRRHMESDDVHSNPSEGRLAIFEQSGVSVPKSLRFDRRNSTQLKTLSVQDMQSSNNTVVRTQSDSRGTNSHLVHSTPAHVQRGEERASVSGSSSVSKNNQSRHKAAAERMDTSSDEDEDAVRRAHIPRKRLTGSKRSPAVPAEKQSNSNQHCSTSTEHSPSAAKAQTSDRRQKDDRETGGAVSRRGQATTSARQSHHDRVGNPSGSHSAHGVGPPLRSTNPSGSHSAHGVAPPLRSTNLRKTAKKTCSVGLRPHDISDTVPGTASGTEASSDDSDERIRSYISDWIEFRERSEDPQQKRLRQLKLTEDLMKKVEECLGRP